MIRRQIWFLFFVACTAGTTVGQALPSADPAEAGLSQERLARVTAFLDEYVEQGRLPGGVVLVARDGAVVLHEAFGYRDVEADDAMRTDAIFRIASQTKALVSVGVMILFEEGKLLLTDPVGEYLPEYAETTVAVADGNGGFDVVDAARSITILDLLTHTAGIGYGGGPGASAWEEAGIQGWYFADRSEPIRETIRRMADLPMDAQPGTAWVYGYNTDILGALIEVVSGRNLDDFLRERILEPLRMNDTHFFLPASKEGRLSVVYSVNRDGELERAPDPGHMTGQGLYVRGPRMSLSGGAGLLSTSTDYARFLQMLLNQGELDGVRVLSPWSVALMTVDQLGDIRYPWADPPGSMGFGLGFEIVEQIGAGRLPGSPGMFSWGGAYHSTYWVDPLEGLVVVYFTQVIPATDLDDRAKLQSLIYQALQE